MTQTGQEVGRDATGKSQKYIITVAIQHTFKAVADVILPVSVITEIPVNTKQLMKSYH